MSPGAVVAGVEFCKVKWLLQPRHFLPGWDKSGNFEKCRNRMMTQPIVAITNAFARREHDRPVRRGGGVLCKDKLVVPPCFFLAGVGKIGHFGKTRKGDDAPARKKRPRL